MSAELKDSNFCMVCGNKISQLKNRKLLRIAIIVIICSAILAGGSYVLWGKECRYKAEQKRFQKVLTNASDEELFITLKYAIAYDYVPDSQIDPFYNRYVMVGVWQRSLMVYDTLRNRRTDLLREIYPNMDVLDEYVRWESLPEGPIKTRLLQILYCKMLVRESIWTRLWDVGMTQNHCLSVFMEHRICKNTQGKKERYENLKHALMRG